MNPHWQVLHKKCVTIVHNKAFWWNRTWTITRAIDCTQICYTDKQAEYSNRPLNHLRSAPLTMTVKLTIATKDILSVLNRERQQHRRLECMVWISYQSQSTLPKRRTCGLILCLITTMSEATGDNATAQKVGKKWIKEAK